MFPLPLPQTGPATLSIDLSWPGVAVSPSLYGIFFEEINQAGDGGVYGELLRNRGLERTEGPNGMPLGWSGSGITLDPTDGPNMAHPASLRIEDGRTLANEGFWGMPVRKGERYRLVVWAKGTGALSASLAGETSLGKPGDGWRRVEKTLVAGIDDPKARLGLTAKGGPVSIGYASLFPEKTWKGRKNGLHPYLAEKVAAMKPNFVRFPGGCYVEGGDRFADMFDWKRSIGAVDERKGVAHSMWGYPNTFGLGYHEYLQWCEDMGSAPLFVVNCGINHRQITPMDEMGPFVQDALDAIEYANGPTTSKWGALRAKNGHPKPFGLKYIEIGNENGSWFFGGDAAYTPRYRLIYDAIKAKHPEIVTISDAPIDAPMEMVDEHYYRDPSWFWKNKGRYDAYDRKGPKIYVGEYAVTEGCGRGNLAAALGEAAFMTGMERNSDVVTMSSYAPLLVNVNNRQWNPNAIVFDGTRAYGTPSYHVQALFANNRPDRNVRVEHPEFSSAPPKPGGGIGLMTWATKAEFKDVELSADGKTIYSSSGITGGSLVDPRGQWSVRDGVVSQTSLENDRTVTLTGATAPESGYTLKVKARKVAGDEGFLIVFDLKSGSQLRWNVGGWGNTQTAFERNGAVVGERVPVTVQADRWYDVRIERQADETRAYLDGKLIQTLHETGSPALAAIAGIDDRAKELVVKVVNGSEEARPLRLDLGNASIKGTGRAIVLTGADLMAENTFDAPTRIGPRESKISGIRSGSTYTFAPRSLTILRLKL